MRNQNYESTRVNLRGWLEGRGYYRALRMMDIGLQYHTGVRKDGVMPEYQHQISQANYVRTLPNLMYPEETLTCVLGHDLVEDTEFSLQEVKNIFGEKIAFEIELMTNKFSDGTKKPKESYYKAISLSPIASIAKGADRIHNHQTMGGVFTSEKQMSYIDETKTYILPALKSARKLYPEQSEAYQNIKTVLQVQIELIELMNTK